MTPGSALRVAHIVYTANLGGSETIAAEICRRLPADRFDARVLMMFPGDGPLPAFLDARGVPHGSLRNVGWKKRLNPFYLASCLRKHRIDILHVHHIPLYWYIRRGARLAGIPVVGCTEHASHSISMIPALQRESRHAARHARFFAVVSEHLKRYFTEELGIPAEGVIVVPNGVDTERFSPGPNTGTAPSGSVRLISVGRLVDAKDYPTLFAAAATLRAEGREFSLSIVGDGDLRANVEANVARSGLNDTVRLLGNRTDVGSLLQSSDAFVLSSRREGLPVSVLEALATGLPVVATKVGAIPDVVNDGENGLLVPPGDPQALAAAIRRLLDDAPLRRLIGETARRLVVEQYSLDRMVDRYAEIYDSAAGRHP